MSQISIEGMEFFAYHGCFEEEQIIGNKFIVDIFLEVSTEQAQRSDNLSQTVNYQKVYEVIREQMNVSSSLLEHLGHRINEAVRTQFPAIKRITLKVCKLYPPIGGKVDRVCFTLNTLCEG